MIISMTSYSARFTGNENFILNRKPVEENLSSFWSWAYSELDSNMIRSVLAEYIVASALDITEEPGESYRQMWRPYDLGYKGLRIEVKSASSVQTWNSKHKGNYIFSIAPARVPGEEGDYKEDAPLQRNSDLYVFAIFEPEDEGILPLNLDAWQFLILPTRVLDEMSLTQKSIAISSLMKLEPRVCNYSELKECVDRIMIDNSILEGVDHSDCL